MEWEIRYIRHGAMHAPTRVTAASYASSSHAAAVAGPPAAHRCTCHEVGDQIHQRRGYACAHQRDGYIVCLLIACSRSGGPTRLPQVPMAGVEGEHVR